MIRDREEEPEIDDDYYSERNREDEEDKARFHEIQESYRD